MSGGLAALFHRDGRPVAAPAAEAMLAAVPYRGVDGRQVRCWDGVALGQARRALTPTDADETQPVVSPRTGCALVADARLDNRRQLLVRLPDASPFGGDAELILRAYERWGDDAPAALLGDFAFVLWDPRRQCLVCARDTSGQRPLFYRLDGRTFAAGSEIHQLLQDRRTALVPDAGRLREYLVPLCVYRNDQEQAQTFYQGVLALPAGHTLVVGREAVRLWRYWDLRPGRELRYRRDQDYVQHFGDLFVDAVRVRVRSAGAVGALLSGGLDSASVVCMAHTLRRLGVIERQAFTALSMVFDDLDCDESSFIRDVEARHEFRAQRVPVADQVANLLADPPGFMPMPAKPVSEIDLMLAAASEAGVRVVLSGHMGDNCFGWSQQFFDSLLVRGRLGELWRHLRAYRRTAQEPLRETVARYCLLPLLPLWAQRPLRVALARRDARREAPELLPDWIADPARADLLERHLALREQAAAQRRFASEERERIFRSLQPAEVLPIGGAQAVQLVCPFADRRLHEFVLSIPPEQLYEPHPYAAQFYAGSKLILRRAMLEILPESVRTRTRKTHFASLVQYELASRWSEYRSVFGPGSRSEVAQRGLIEPARFWRRLQQLRDTGFGEDGVYVTRVLHLETWLRAVALGHRSVVSVARRPVSFDVPVAARWHGRPPRSERRPAALGRFIPLGKEVIAT